MGPATAHANLMISSADGQPAYMRVDHSNTYNPNMYPGGRTSVRISTKETLTHGLIISDIAHMPGGICGTWSAHWTLGPDWPSSGEIDIIEGVNSASRNLMSLHTSPNCTIAGDAELGTLQSNNCDTTDNLNAGCGVLANTTASYGTGFNRGNGGIYATQWTSDFIRIWFFAAGSVPSDITAGTPDPSLWGRPQANLQGSCNIDTHFANHSIIFDTTFCGDYAGKVWSSDPTCKALAPTCHDYVASNPAAFQDAYWSINSVKVYKLALPSNSSTSSSSFRASITSSGVHFSNTMASSTSLSSMVPQSSVLVPGMGNNTAATVTPTSTLSSSSVTYGAAVSTGSTTLSTSTAVPLSDPMVVGTFRYVACVGSQSSYSAFTRVDDSAMMTLERCTTECASYKYAGVFKELCLCGNTLDVSTGTNDTQGDCNMPCPGNLSQICGGQVAASSRLARRQTALSNVLLTLYTNTAVAKEVSAGTTLPGSTTAVGGAAATSSPTTPTFGISAAPNTSTALISAQPQSSVLGFGMGGSITASDTYTTVLTTIYVDLCSTGLTTLTTTLTTTHCSCLPPYEPTPTIPMTVVCKVCSACGESGSPSTLTVTVPITSGAGIDAIAASSTIAATAYGTATLSPGLPHNALPKQGNGTTALASVTGVPSTVGGAPAATQGSVVATELRAANASGVSNATWLNPVVMFEGGAGWVGTNLGVVILGMGAVIAVL
ncbi:MAG: putative endo-1,3(4)-beta-glucanase [Lasallia pustulata]|uniref:Putative endo-1,3(4)-beta-glucanase n=1 Tax=Lasallia pustulata TaxID=136370 RepID=A0A5M8PNN3_9LECA|nr:MAG: putative endo-1,3(4)-beta-glucanase [Lasallia pustulata]